MSSPHSLLGVEALSAAVTGRSSSVFQDDLDAAHDVIAEGVCGRRLLVVGGAGSIGAATVHELLRYGPAAVHIVDISENSLVELVRDLRSADRVGTAELSTTVADFGSPSMAALLRERLPFDAVFNFAAVKHVRSEKDIYGILHMIDNNVIKAERLLNALLACGSSASYFAVSTDKAAMPANVMGATKRLMELTMFGARHAAVRRVTSARFPNVAFSAGSLLAGFRSRLERAQPLAVPADTRRFLITHAEGAQICLLAALVAPRSALLVPAEGALAESILQDAAEAFLRANGYRPAWHEHEGAAIAALVADRARGHYPVLLTRRDTAGEKPSEEFFEPGEAVEGIGLRTVRRLVPVDGDQEVLDRVVAALTAMVLRPNGSATEKSVDALLHEAIPTYAHREARTSLDGRM